MKNSKKKKNYFPIITMLFSGAEFGIRFRCYCGKSYTTHSNLKRHQNEHADFKQFGCNLCGYRNHRKDRIRLHMIMKHRHQIDI